MMTKNITGIDVYDVGPQCTNSHKENENKLEWVIHKNITENILVLIFPLVPFFDKSAWRANFSKAY